MTVEKIVITDLSRRAENNSEKYPTLMTSGCCEDVLYDDTQKWVEEFQAKGMTYSVYASKYDQDSWNGKKHTKVLEWSPYPLDDVESKWIDEDSVSFTDPSAGWVSYATTSLYKGRKYLAPWVEYNPTYDGLNETDIENDIVAIEKNIVLQRGYAVKHRDLIAAAIEEEGLDGFVEYYPQETDGVYFDNYSAGFRVGIDMQQAIQHFGTFANYQAWWTRLVSTYTIEEMAVV